MNIKMTGMVSGLDTDTIVSALVSAQRYKVTKLTKKKTKTEWKADAWKELNTKIYALYTGTLDSLRWSSTYGAKATTISNTSLADVTAGSNAVDGTQTLAVKQLAKSGYMTGGEISTSDGSTLSADTKLSQLGYTGGDATFAITVGGNEKTISLSGDTKISDVISQLKNAGVSASFDVKNKRIFVNSKTSGLDGDFDFSATTTDGLKALKSLGLYAKSDVSNAAYTEWASYDGYSYVSGYTGTDATQIAYNQKYEALLAQKEASYQAKVDEATTSLEDIYTAAGYSSYDDYLTAVCGGTDAASIEAKKQDMESNISTYTADLETAKSEKEALQADMDALDPTDANYQTEKDALQAQIDAKQADMDAIQANIDSEKAASDELNSATSYSNIITTNNSNLANVETEVQNELQTRAAAATSALSTGFSSGAVKIAGQDAIIELNGAEFKSNTNSFSINGLTIVAKETSTYTTKDDGSIEYNATSITTTDDYQATYDVIKKFFKEYNALIVEMDTLYNADAAKGYEPLTDEEKEAMTDDQVEKWEDKIKDAILRKDSTLSEVTLAMKTAMSGVYEYNGTKYSLASFGIETGAYFSTDKNQRGVYHIDGDSEDSTSSANADKLMAALASDKDAVVNFFSKLAGDVYSTLTDKMKSISGVRTVYHVYNDQSMASEVDDYEEQIKKLETKISALEERYYKQFSAMEVALQKLNESSSALSGLLGS